jgi:hypothetical protein
MNPLPSLRSPLRPGEPSPNRDALNRFEDELRRRAQALAELEARVHDREQRVAEAERRLELDATGREFAAEQTNVTAFDRRTPAQIMALADAAIRAGQKRRGEIVDDEPPPNTEVARLAAAAIAAGRRARGEV